MSYFFECGEFVVVGIDSKNGMVLVILEKMLNSLKKEV